MSTRTLPTAGWRYAASAPGHAGRDLRLDLLRGLCILKMVLNHLWATPLHAIHHWVGFVSAAEGFFFLSGVLVGIVHGRRAEREGLATASRALLARASQIYLANLGLVLLFASLELTGFLDSRPIVVRLRVEGWSSLFDMSQAYYLHVLPRYVMFLAVAPLALWLLRSGKGWLLLAASAAIWAGNLLTFGGLSIPWAEDPATRSFAAASWQLVFFVGVAIGFHRERAGSWFERAVAIPGAIPAAAAAAVGLAWSHAALLAGDLRASPEVTRLWLERDLIAPVRLLNLAIVSTLVFWLVDRWWHPIARASGWLLLPFGSQALAVYLIHVPLRWLGTGLLQASSIPLLGNGWLTLFPVGLAIALLWGMTRWRVGFWVIPR